MWGHYRFKARHHRDFKWSFYMTHHKVMCNGRNHVQKICLMSNFWNFSNSMLAILLVWVYVCVLSCFRHFWLFETPWTVAHQDLCSWGSPGKNTAVGCHVLLQRTFSSQGSNLHLLFFLIVRQFINHFNQTDRKVKVCPYVSRVRTRNMVWELDTPLLFKTQ